MRAGVSRMSSSVMVVTEAGAVKSPDLVRLPTSTFALRKCSRSMCCKSASETSSDSSTCGSTSAGFSSTGSGTACWARSSRPISSIEKSATTTAARGRNEGGRAATLRETDEGNIEGPISLSLVAGTNIFGGGPVRVASIRGAASVHRVRSVICGRNHPVDLAAINVGAGGCVWSGVDRDTIHQGHTAPTRGCTDEKGYEKQGASIH